MARDLWDGADVQWIGHESTFRGVRLRPGDKAVVTDAGRNHVASFSSLHSAARPRQPRPGRGVTIRLAGGDVVAVPRRHLLLVAPDHPLAPEPDGTQGAWWLEQLAPWGEHGLPVSSLVPSSLPAVCQVLHPWWGPDPEPISWRAAASRFGFASVAEFDRSRGMGSDRAAQRAGLYAERGQFDNVTAGALIDNLTNATTTAHDVFVAVWDGWGDVPAQRFPGAARLATPRRGHFLLRGPLTGVLASIAASNSDRPAAGLWWPADRSWFVATEIDFEWTFVGGRPTLMESLYADQRLEAAPTSFEAEANRAAEPA